MIISLDSILNKACELWSVSKEDVLSHKKAQPLPFVRSMVAWNIKECFNISLAKLGQFMNRSHGTISYYLTLYECEYLFNKQFRNMAEKMRNFTLDMVNEFQEELQEELCEIIG